MWPVLWQPRQIWMFTCKFRTDSLRAIENGFWKPLLPLAAVTSCRGCIHNGNVSLWGGHSWLTWRACCFLLFSCRFNKYVCTTDFWMHVSSDLTTANGYERTIQLCWSKTDWALKELIRLPCDIFRRKYCGGFVGISFFNRSYIAIFAQVYVLFSGDFLCNLYEHGLPVT
jgi:hypothetical protein